MKRLSQLKVFVCQYLPLSGDCWKHCHRGLPCGWIQNLRTLHCWCLTSRNAFLGDPHGWRRLKALYGWFFCLLWKDVQLHLSRSSGSLPWKMTPLPLFLLCVVFFFCCCWLFFPPPSGATLIAYCLQYAQVQHLQECISWQTVYIVLTLWRRQRLSIQHEICKNF